jgi:hypothetical protein
MSRVYQDNRPFSGRAISQWLHPYCDAWAFGDETEHCSQHPKPGMASCLDKKFSHIRFSGQLDILCIRVAAGGACKNGGDEKTHLLELMTNQGLKSRPVWGHYCPL